MTSRMRPWLLGIPTFAVVTILLFWSIAKLAGWIFVVLRLNK
jgi:Na+/melibiose symporter-like transporter